VEVEDELGFVLSNHHIPACVPDGLPDRAGRLARDRSVIDKTDVIQFVVVDLDGEPIPVGSVGYTFWDRPRREDAIALQPQIEMVGPRPMLVDDETGIFGHLSIVSDGPKR